MYAQQLHNAKCAVPFVVYPDQCRSATIDAILQCREFSLLEHPRNFALKQLQSLWKAVNRVDKLSTM